MPQAKADVLVLLSQIRKGAFVQLVNEQLTELNRALFETDGEGEITITLKMKPGGEGQVTIVPKVKTRKPVRPVGDAIFYVTVDGDLEREDPRQGSMFPEPKLTPFPGGKKPEDNN